MRTEAQADDGFAAANTPSTLLKWLPDGSAALVLGASGAIGRGFLDILARERPDVETRGASRSSQPGFDLKDEASIAALAEFVAKGPPLRLVVNAAGVLHSPALTPERTWRQCDPDQMGEAFAVNAIGPALLLKHLLPLLPPSGKSVFALLSARVGSIADNQLGGWYSYRASKAALNQIVRTAAVELRRRSPEALCVSLHPGTVHSRLSAPFTKSGLHVRPASDAAFDLLKVIDTLQPSQSGEFFDYRGEPLPW